MPFTYGTPLGRRVPWRAHTLFAALLIAGVAHAQQAAFTLDAALQSATDQSASMQAAQASVRASSEAAVKAGQLPDPMLKAGIDNLPINGGQRFTIGQDFMTARRIGIEQEWVSGNKRRLRSTLASEMVGRERAGYLMQLANVRQQTATAWLNAIYAKQALALQQALLDHMSHELAATKASYRGAKASAADVIQAQAMLAQTQDQVLKAQQTYQTATIGLSRWTAVPVTDVTGQPPAPESFVSSLPLEELRILQPALVAAADDIAVAEADTAVANSERSPNWTWEIAYQQRGGAYSNMVSVGVTIPLPLNRKNRQNRDVAEKAELATKARLTYEDTLRQVQADIRSQSAILASGRERITHLSQSLLPAADQRVQLANAAYRAGTGPLADTFAARRAQLDAQLQVLDLKREVSQTWAQLEYQVVPSTMAAAQ
ncbi:TolC family protein [Burkholderia multivorans]|jgi:outer membrane protein TolC|uniref:TolC family protein n=1 Tax=Burkholderia TaxID=32008 RepID=UPI000398B282|nr:MULTISPECIES: TolC family protein [Burkholderia]ERJ39835.1 Heavy metal RND efflux outer membrane protein, CzcC family [Burkholderia sp. AU4i]MBU9146438.1 TolC family protein [Burkholderia multivorans]MBU9439623.1 TolC family protein [Burkholderia multivorans]MBU9539804.1 TolC family protein [Burkholderia multivorans]MDD1489849.1 TolC family protein [Burkholderia thailandensis]